MGILGSLAEKVRLMFGNRVFQALVHVPVVGGFLALIFGIFMIGMGKKLAENVRLGIAAQIFVPGVFFLISAARWIAWFFSLSVKMLEMAEMPLFYLSVAWLAIGYLLMLRAAFLVFTSKDADYWMLQAQILWIRKLLSI